MTKFFEPINASATHVYHSALELCPTSSIVRKLYYHRCHGITRLPRVVIGTPDSWDPTISFSGRGDYESCALSPCGRFVAAQTEKSVEVRNQVTFELLTSFQSIKHTPLPACPLAYSPDGRSLACGFSNAIVIWDIQTGGVAKEIECCWGIVSLEWSSDGKAIAATLGCWPSTPGVRTYDVASGAQLFGEDSTVGLGITYHLWPYKESFRFTTIKLHEALLEGDPHTLQLSTSEIGPTPTKVEQITVTMGERWVVEQPSLCTIAFSPSAYRISVLGPSTLRVLDARNSDCSLHERNRFTSCQFSPDGSLFAASRWEAILVWKYTSGSYIQCGEYLFRYLPFPSRNKLSLQFSPTSSSILSLGGNFIQVRRLHDLPTAQRIHPQYAAISQSGSRIATALKSESTITIIDLHSQTPPRFIDTGMGIEGLVITGNVLLVASPEKIAAWLLTAEGLMDGALGAKRADHRDSIWTISSPIGRGMLWDFWVDPEGQVGVINADIRPFVYHIGSGEVLQHTRIPERTGRLWVGFYQLSDCRQYHHLRYHDRSQHDSPPEDGWLIPDTTMEEGKWVIGPEGGHRFWVPVEWRGSWDRKNWHHDITTLFGIIADQPVVIKL